jgi:hypothetical protein
MSGGWYATALAVAVLVLAGHRAGAAGDAAEDAAEDAAGDADGAGRLVIDNPTHDFGAVEQGALVRHVFRFRNAGTEALRAGGVDTPCGCTAAVISDGVVPPGGEGTVEVLFDTGGFRGRKTKTVSFSTNDPTQPAAALTLTGEVTAEVVVDPPMLYLGRLHPAQDTTGEIRILSTTGRSIDVASAVADNPAFDLAAEPFSEAGSAGWRVVVRVGPGMPRGTFSERVRITTTNPRYADLSVPVFGSVEGDLLVLPPRITFGPVAQGGRSTRALSIRNLGVEPFAISGVRAPDFSLDSYTVHTVIAGYEYRIILRLKEGVPARHGPGALYIYTTHPEESEVVVPLYALAGDWEQ